MLSMLRKAWMLVLERLPEHTKRLIFVTSLTASVKRSNNLDDRTLHKLNEIMELCRTEGAMKLPVAVSQVIWNERVVHDATRILKEDQTDNLSELIARFKEQAPPWLQYDPAAMESDMKRLNEHRLEVFGR